MKKNLKNSEIYASFCDISEPTWFRWKKKHQKLTELLEKYFTPEDILEFQRKNEIDKLEKAYFILDEILESSLYDYFQMFHNGLKQFDELFIIYYFSFLAELKSAIFEKSTIFEIKDFFILDIFQLISSFSTSFSIIDMNRINRHILIFKEWDRNMLFFIHHSLSFNLFNLHDHKFYSPSMSERKEAVYHILGLYVFTNNTELEPDRKLKKLNSLYTTYESLPTQDRLRKIDEILNKLGINLS